MAKNVRNFIITCVITFVLVAGGIYALGNGEGIVILEGYEHGVGFCKPKFQGVVHPADATVWEDELAHYVVNEGHYKDPEVKDLIELTHKICAKEEK